MTEVITEMAQAFRAGKSPKKIVAKNLMSMLMFSKNVMQSMNSKEPYMQLPHFDSVTVGKIKNKLNNMSILNYCKLDKEKRLEVVKHVFEGKGDVNYIADQQEKCIDNLPVVEMKIEAKVEGEDEIVVGDIMSINLTIKYLKNQEGEKHGYVHSKNYPFLRRDNWYLVITDPTMTTFAAVEKLEIKGAEFTKTFKERISRPGPIQFLALLINDSYKGLDQNAMV